MSVKTLLEGFFKDLKGFFTYLKIWYLKGTVSVILSDPPGKDLTAISDRVGINYCL